MMKSYRFTSFQVCLGEKMNSKATNFIDRYFSGLLLLLIALVHKPGFGQDQPNFEIDVTDLNITWASNQGPSIPNVVNVGSVISAQIIVQLQVDPNNPFAIEKIQDVPPGETITAVVELRDNNGNVINIHEQTFPGFSNSYPDRILDNTPDGSGNIVNQVSFTIPWSEAYKKTKDNKEWSIVAYVYGSSTETRLQNNFISHKFELNIPNLKFSATPTVVSNSNPPFLPNTDIFVSAFIENNGSVQTPPGSFFSVEAILASDEMETEVYDSEVIILPVSDDGSTATIDPGLAYREHINFRGLRIPKDIDDTNMTIIVKIDQRDNVIPEDDDQLPNPSSSDNIESITILLPTNITTPRLNISQLSFIGESGRFDGLEPIRISFSVRNEGDSPVSSNDDLRIRVVLSNDDRYDLSDYVLREFNFGGELGELGYDLLPNENVLLDWIQQLPDNLEGDYYLLASVFDGSGIEIDTYPLSNTPTVTLRSENTSSLERVVSGVRPNERPDSSLDGRFVVYEETDGNGVKQIWYRDTVVGSQAVLVSRNMDANSSTNIGGNQNSLRPKISADGKIITFHSRASNLVPNDKNEHADVFIFKTVNGQVIRALNAYTNQEPNGASLYPDINGDGSKIVFQSRATNLSADGTTTNGEQIFLWDTTIGTYGSISAITAGNNGSREVSIDDGGTTILFSSDATNLDFGKADNNGKSDIYAHDLATGRTWIVSLNKFSNPGNGVSDQPAISGNGHFFVFRSDSTNLIRRAGISTINVVRGGVGYFGSPQAFISDENQTGEGAIISLENAVDDFGQIMPGKIDIIDPGHDYTKPIVTIIADSPEGIPTALAEVEAFMSHPEGEIYFAELGDPGVYTTTAASMKRVSENALGIGGNQGSKDPHIDYSGNRIVYSTKSSNLLADSLTRSDGTSYLNRPSSMAKAKAIIVGGIGEIEVLSAGKNYQSGSLTIEDSSGRGFGATATYQVDDLGQISSINVITPGQDYDLSSTSVTVTVPGGGTGFVGGDIRFLSEQGIGEMRQGGGANLWY